MNEPILEPGDVAVRVPRRTGATEPLPAILYVRGDGWILDNAGTRDQPVRELTARARPAVIFAGYSRSPAGG